MKRHPHPKMLSLYAGGDLEGAESIELSAHLAECPQCCEVLTDFQAFQRILRVAVPEPAGIDLQLTRQRITERILQRRQAAKWRWAISSAAAALTIIVLAVVFSRRSVQLPLDDSLRVPLMSRSIHLTLELPEAERMLKVHHPARVGTGLRAANFVPRGDGTFQLRLTTADPNVIILLPPATESTVEP